MENKRGVTIWESGASTLLMAAVGKEGFSPFTAACMHQQPHMRDGAVNEGWQKWGRRTRERLFARGTSR